MSYWISLITFYLIGKSGEVLIETLLNKVFSQLWQWLREEPRVQKLKISVKLHILAWYLALLLRNRQ